MLYEQPQNLAAATPLNIQADRTATNFTVRPWPVFWGLHRAGGTYLDRIFSYRTEALTKSVQTGKSSSSEITTAINYYGSIAQAVGFGPLHQLYAIIKDDEPVWEGGLIPSATPYLSVSFGASNVPMILYTGEQEDGTMRGGGMTDSSMPAGHPPYRGLMWFVFDEILFGSTPNPPNFEIIFEVIHRALVLDPANTTGDPENDDIELHRVDRGQLVPEIIYSAFTNPLFGGSMTEENFDLPSWVAACNQLKTEGIGYSAKMDTKTNPDAWLKRLLDYVDGEITDHEGKWRFRLRRSSDVRISIPESAFLKPPIIQPGGWNDASVVNDIRASYYPLGRNLEPLPISAADDTSREIIGVRSKTLSYDGIRTEAAGVQFVNRLVRSLGFPTVRYTLKLDRSQRDLQKGDLITPVYPRLDLDGSIPLRISDISFPKPGAAGITVVAEVDKTALDDQAGAADDEITYTQPTPQAIKGHITAMPSTLLDGFSDGAIIPLCRTSAADDRALVNFGWDGTVFDTVAARSVFQLCLDVDAWRDFGNNNFALEFSFSQDHEEDTFLASITDILPDWHLLTVASNATTEITPSLSIIRAGSAVQALGSGRYSISFEGGQFGTGGFSHPNANPRVIAYMGPLDSFLTLPSNQKKFASNAGNATTDTAKRRRFVIESSTRGNRQDFADGYAFEYNRSTDSHSSGWGAAVTHAFDYGITVLGSSGGAPLESSIEIAGSEGGDYSIDWGEGDSIITGTRSSWPFTISNTFDVAGTYTATLVVTPTAGGAAQTFTITITAS